MSQWWQILTRKKELDQQQEGELGRVLNVFDLTLLGVGSTLGVGVYVLAGHVARDTAGPSVIISFLIAALASVFAGLCYAEFGARVPKAGSAYIYSYVSVGEIVAFIIGWNLILEYMIGSASVARAFTLYLDNLLGYKLNSTFAHIAPINVDFMSPYFDFLSFGITVLLGVGMAFGLKESKWVNNVFTILNVLVVVFVVVAGAYFGNIDNWKLTDVPDGAGAGGFKPFGIEGIFKGAATCFYGFVGFDCIATTGEEVKNPKKAIPISIIVSLFIIFLAYFGTSAVVTLMWPYYDLDPNSPIPYGFDKNDFQIGKWIVAVGGMFGLAASLFGAMFPLPRIIYAMAEDSLIFRFLGSVNKRFKTPVVGTLIAAVSTGLMSALFDLKQLVNMMSIGTLLAYTMVATCVLLLRYSLDEEDIADIKYSLIQDSDSSDYEYNESSLDDGEHSNLLTSKKKTAKAVVEQMFNFKKKSPNHLTRKIVNVQIVFFCFLALLFGACMKWLIHKMVDLEIWALAVTSAVVFFMMLTLCSISAQPNNPTKLPFQVPFVPLLPAISICVNVYLMLMLDVYTWIRFGVWMAIGLPIYLISACLYRKQKLTKPHRKSLSEFSIQNGIDNYSYVDEETVQESTTLTIVPEIVIEPATPVVLPETPENKKITLRKKYSIFERPITETELYRDLTKNITPVHSPRDSERRISLVFSKEQNMKIVDTDTESESSQEHHIRADVHREHDSDSENEENSENLKQPDASNVPLNSSSESDDAKSDGSHEEAINLLNRVIEEAESTRSKQRNASTISLCSFEMESTSEEAVEIKSPEIPDGSKLEQTDSANACSSLGKCVTIEAETGESKKIPCDDSDEIEADDPKENEKRTDGEQSLSPAPPAPPLPPTENYFKFTPPQIKSSAPRAIKPSPTPQITASQIQNVNLKKTQTVPKRKRSEIDFDFNDTVKGGTAEMQRIKDKLNAFYRDFKPPATPVYKTQQSETARSAKLPPAEPEKPPSPEIITTTDEYAKSNDFKEKLGTLLLKNSLKEKKNRSKNVPIEKSIDDREHHKIETNANLDDPGGDKETKNQNETPQQSLAEHKKKMIGTLRSIKLRKTGILDLDFENSQKSRSDDKPAEENR